MKDTSLAHHERHWHYVRKRRHARAHHTTREMLYGQLFSIVGSVAAGLLLDIQKDTIQTLIGAFLILPGIFELTGSVAGAMAARISHRQVGTARLEAKLVRDSVSHAFLLSFASALLLGIVGGVATKVLLGGALFSIWISVVMTVLITSSIGLPLIALTTKILKKKGFDPDNVIGPIETTVFDILCVIVLSLVVGVVV